MAYGIKYTTSYKRRSGGTTVIDILESGYSGAVTTLIADYSCLQIQLDGDVNNIYSATRGSGAIIRLLVPALTMTSLFTIDPQKYVVKIYSDYSGGNLIWQGFVNTGVYQESYDTNGLVPITLTCGDGMSVLGDIPYKESASGNTYTGYMNLSTVMQNIFSKLGISFTTIRTSNDLKVFDLGDNLFLDLIVNNENYLDEDGKAMSCRQVLESIFQPLGLVVTFRGAVIYLIDPINLHTPAKGQIFATTPIYGYGGGVDNLGGVIDISGTTVSWYQTGQMLDVQQPFNQVEVRYDPYNFTSASYDFNAEGNAGNTGNYSTVTNNGVTYNKYFDVTMKDWQINGLYKFEGIQKVVPLETHSIDFFIKQEAGLSGSYEYTIPLSNIKQDENLRLELSMDIYVATKHASNIWSTGATTLVQEIQIPVYIKVGNQWYGGGYTWGTTLDSTTLKLRTPSTQLIQTFTREGWWLWRHTEVVNTDESVINDTWTTGKIIVNMGQSSSEDLINGSITVLIPKTMVLENVTPWTAEAHIKNLLIKNIRVQALKADLTPITNEGINTTATLYNFNTIRKSPLAITLTSGCGNYGSSKAAFSTNQQVVQGTNIKGLLRGSDPTLYDTAKLLAQNLISQYKQPRTKLTASLDASSYLLNLEHYLISDTRYRPGKAFYIANAVYYDSEEYMQVEMLELTGTRETIE